MYISWYGKYNFEMYFWYVVYFYQWGCIELLEKSLVWYKKILLVGKVEVVVQGFCGVWWLKMVGIDGCMGFGGINLFIIWNQFNLIYLCELVYWVNLMYEMLEKY